jgi:hypothetical protein
MLALQFAADFRRGRVNASKQSNFDQIHPDEEQKASLKQVLQLTLSILVSLASIRKEFFGSG